MLSDWGVPVAVMGLVLATVMSAALAGRYQNHQRRIWTSVKCLEGAAEGISRSLEELAKVPLSRECRMAFLSDVLARYRRIRRLQRRYPEIATRIQYAEQALQGESERTTGTLGPIESAASLRRILRSLDYLIELLEHDTFVQPMPRDVRIIFRRELGERRAEVVARYHLVQSKRLAEAGDTATARGHLAALQQVLRQQVPRTDFVRALQAEAQAAAQTLSGRPFASSDDAQGASAA